MYKMRQRKVVDNTDRKALHLLKEKMFNMTGNVYSNKKDLNHCHCSVYVLHRTVAE